MPVRSPLAARIRHAPAAIRRRAVLLAIAAGFFARDPAAGIAARIACLAPGTIRWPGGTEADFYDWRSGRTAGGPHPRRYRLTLAGRARVCRRTGAIPIFDTQCAGRNQGPLPR